jgi:hypothetical protein
MVRFVCVCVCITNRLGLFLPVGRRHLGTWLLQKIEKAYIFCFAVCVALRSLLVVSISIARF